MPVILLVDLLVCTAGLSASATPTQEEVFKSISSSVDSSVDPRAFLALVAAVGGVIIILAVVKLRGQRTVNPRALNHSGKLIKEVGKRVNLRPAELKQLRLMGDSQGISPLTLLLCPSLFVKSVKENPARLDRAVVAGLVKKITTRPLQPN